jgi:NadR type nicotinamide-nucleotide adenylyltransferase
MKKVVIIGPESTGKSTLSKDLAAHYQTSWAPEYAREYLNMLQRDYRQDDLWEIAKGQLLQEEQASARACNKLLFCDTDLYVIKVWSEHKYHSCDLRILKEIAQRKYDLYLLCYIDVPWEDDPQRENPSPEMRQYFYYIYHDIVLQAGIPWADIRGSRAERLSAAITAIEKIKNL